jgi:hypothetical protein
MTGLYFAVLNTTFSFFFMNEGMAVLVRKSSSEAISCFLLWCLSDRQRKTGGGGFSSGAELWERKQNERFRRKYVGLVQKEKIRF